MKNVRPLIAPQAATARFIVALLAIALVAFTATSQAQEQRSKATLAQDPVTAREATIVESKPERAEPPTRDLIGDAIREVKDANDSAQGLFASPGANSPTVAGTCETAGPIEVESSGGTAAGVSTPYATLALAFTAINGGTLHLGIITIDVCGNTTETGTGASLNQVAGVTSVTMSPAGGAARTISGAITAGNSLINLNGADNVTINGLNTGGNSLTLSNTTVSTTSGTATVRFVADASTNTVTNTTILGSSTATLATSAANIVIGSGTTTGNDNITISNNNIGPVGANLPSKAIIGSGTSSAIENDNAQITGNNIFDYFSATQSHSGINVLSGDEAWTISNNKFYQTAPRTFTAATMRHAAITINNTSGGFTISGNTIGFGAANGTGTYTISGLDNEFRAIDLPNVRTTAPATLVQNNTISGINQTSSRNNTTGTSSSAFIAVAMGTTDGLINATGNTIGSLDGSSTIVLNLTSITANTVPVVGFYNFSFFSTNISNNNIGAITIQSTGTTTGFRGILVNTGTALTATINNNVIGGTNAAGAITNTQVGAYAMYGIQSALPIPTITGNTIRNLSGASNGAALIVSSGILVSGNTSAATISQNTIHSLSNASGAAANSIYGMSLSLPTAANIVERNFIHSLSLTSTVTGTQIWGIAGGATGTATYKNNMIRLGVDAAGNSITLPTSMIGIRDAAGSTNQFYHNSIYIGGSGVLATPTASNSYCFFSDVVTVTRAYQDNIFWNARSNAVAGGVAHLAIRVGGTAANPAGLTSNYNDLYFSGTDGATGVFNAVVVPTLAAWRTATGQDANSFAADPQLIAPNGTAATVDLHIHPTNPTPIEASGLAIGAVTDDYDGQTRSALTPTDIGADAGNFVGIDLSAPLISYTALANTASAANRTLTATITDATGVPTSGVGLPVLYYRKGASGAFTFAQATFAGGNTYNFTIDHSAIGGVTAGDTIQYYVVAQDTAPTPNVGSNPSAGAAGFTANPPAAATPPTTPNSYSILASISGSFNVGAGQTYATLTAAINALNSSVLTGPVTLVLKDATYSTATGETFPLTINVNGGSSSTNTVTIKPDAGVSPSINGSSASAIFILNGVDWVTIDGTNSASALNAATRDLTITNTNTGTSSAVIWLQTSGTDGATNNTIKNLNATGSGNTQTLIGIGSGSSAISITSAGTGNNSNTVQNNNISKTQYGIYSGGASAANKNTGNVVTQNLINTAAPNNVATGGILANFENAIQITQNDIGNLLKHDGTTGTTGTVFGIALGLVPSNTVTTFTGSDVTGATVTRNRINGLTQLNSTGYSSFGIVVNSVTSGTTLLANNMISGVRSASTASDFSAGIVAGGGAGSTTQIYHNSVSMTGTRGAATFPSYGLAIGSGDPVVDARNNIFYNTQTSTSTGKMYAIGTGSTTFANMTSNFNDFFVSGASAFVGQTGGLGTSGTDRATLLNWQTATGKDANSLSVDPSFVSTTDLHLQAASLVRNAGTPIGAVTTDFDGETRNATTPDIGADETAFFGSLQLSSATYSVGEGAGSLVINVTRTGGNDGAASVHYATADGTAGSADYTAQTGTLNWTDGDAANKTITVPINDDNIFEGDETFSVSLDTATGATLGSPSSAIVTINDNDSAPAFSIDDVTHNEGNSGTTSYTFTITKTGATAGNASVDYETVNGTATAPSDFTAIPATAVTFLPAETTKQVTVFVNGDTTVEPDEAFTVHLSNASGASISDADGTGAITNDDVRPPASVVYVDDDFTGPVGSDPPGPATEIGYDAFPTIQGGVGGVASGGTVNVAAGTYPEQPIIGKSLTLVGAGAGVTNITAPTLLATRFNNFYILVEVNNGASVEASGITVRGEMNLNGCHQAAPASTYRRYYGVYVRGGASLNLHDSAVLDIRENNPAANTNCRIGTAIDAGTTVAGLNQVGTLTLANTTVTGFQSRAVTIDNAGSTATITNNTLIGSTSPNLSQTVILVALGATAQVSGNQITGAQCNDMANCGPDTFTQPASVGISLTAPGSGTQITNNNISNNDYGLNSVTAPNVTPVVNGNTFDANRYFGVNVSEGNATLTGNTFSGVSNVAVVAASVNDPANQTGSDSAITLTSNTVTGATVAFQLLDQPGFPADGFFPVMTAHFNRVVAATAIDNPQNSPSSNFENNWWGCNAGPGNTGCGTVNGTVDFNPWLVLTTSASPNPIAPGGTSTVTADLVHNSDAVIPSASVFVPPTPVSFSATNGAIAPPSATTSNGAATATFTSTSASSGTASATVDNQTTQTNINVTAPTFSIEDVTHNEGDSGTTSYTFTVTKTGATPFNATVDYATVDGTATDADNDYEPLSTATLTFLPADTSKQVTVTVNGDTTFEADETFTVHLSNAGGATITDADGLGTITNDDTQNTGTFQFSAANYSVNESRAIATIAVTRTGSTSGAATIHYATSDGTATDGADYTGASGDLNFADGETSKTFAVSIINDTDTEPDETVTLTLSNPSAGATLGTPNPATLTITDNDGAASSNIVVVLPTDLHGWSAFNEQTASATFVNGPASPPYGSGSYQMSTGAGDGAGMGGKSYFKTNTYNGTRLDAISSMSYSTYVDPSTPGTNLAPVIEMMVDTDGNGTRNTTLVFEPVYSPEQGAVQKGVWQLWNARAGKWRSTATVGPIVPNTYFPLDTFIDAFPNSTIVEWFPRADGFGLGTSVGQASGGAWANFIGSVDGFEIGMNNASTVNDYELALPAISVDDPVFVEGDSVIGPHFTVTLSGKSSVPVTVDYQTADGTAIAGSDYQSASGTLTFAPNETSKDVLITVIGDTANEGTEDFFLNLANPTNATINDAQGIATITDNDDVPAFSIDDVTHMEGNAGTTVYTFTVTKTGATTLPTSVDFATVDGTATLADNDYASASGTLNFAPADTTKQITVNVNGDLSIEPDETFTVHLSNESGATIADADGTGTIQNDDVAAAGILAFSSATYSVNENDAAHHATITVTRSGGSNGSVSVDYTTSDSTATAGSDYTTASGTLTFNDGVTSQTFDVPITDDNVYEGNETINLALSNPQGGTSSLGSPSAAVLTIGDNEAPPAASIDDVTVNEGNSGTTNLAFNVTLSRPSASAVTVHYQTADSTARSSVDYQTASGTVTFPANSTSQPVTVTAFGDVVIEGNETLFVNLSSPTGGATLGDAQGVGTLDNDDGATGRLAFTKNDFDGDARADIAVWSGSTGNWHVNNSGGGPATIQYDWGRSSLGDVAVPADYDGDGKTDYAVWRATDGNWYIIQSSTGTPIIKNWGEAGDLPVPGDYDGDNKTDVAVWREADGNWYILNSRDNTSTVHGWGTSGDQPVLGDFDGDRVTDIAVYRPSEGNWYIVNSSLNSVTLINWGAGGDKPAPADFDGDGKTDITVFRAAGNWYIRNSSDGTVTLRNWGNVGDKLVPGNYDNDNKADIAVWRPSEGTWYIINSASNTGSNFYLGLFGDTPVPSAYLH